MRASAVSADTQILTRCRGRRASPISRTTQADGTSKIATQQWIALFGQGFETWTEWRRTKLPVLTPAVEGDIAEIPSRFYYPTLEPSLNNANYQTATSSIGGDLLTSTLFWQ